MTIFPQKWVQSILKKQMFKLYHGGILSPAGDGFRVFILLGEREE